MNASHNPDPLPDIAALKSRHEPAWNQFLDIYEASFLRQAWCKSRDWDTARDAVQDALCSAIQRLEDGKFDQTGVEHFKNYIFTLIKLRQYVSRGSRRIAGAEEFDFDQIPDEDLGLRRIVLDDETLLVRTAIDAVLTEREKLVIVSLFLGERPMNNREISREYGIAYGTVCSDRMRALAKLRNQLHGLSRSN